MERECTKKVIFGGLLLIGGAIMYSVGIWGLADMDVQANYIPTPKYIGIAAMLVGAVLGFFGLKKNKPIPTYRTDERARFYTPFGAVRCGICLSL